MLELIIAATLSTDPLFLLIDQSKSMEKHKKTVQELIEVTPAAGYMSFSDHKVRLCDDKLRQGKYTPYGDSPLFDAVIKVCEEVKGKAVIVVVTDGKENGSKHTFEEAKEEAELHPDIKWSFIFAH